MNIKNGDCRPATPTPTHKHQWVGGHVYINMYEVNNLTQKCGQFLLMLQIFSCNLNRAELKKETISIDKRKSWPKKDNNLLLLQWIIIFMLLPMICYFFFCVWIKEVSLYDHILSLLYTKYIAFCSGIWGQFRIYLQQDEFTKIVQMKTVYL